MWVGYSWLTNVIDPEEGVIRIGFFAAMAAMLICSLATPEAFGDEGVVFGLAYFAGRVLHILIYRVAARDDPGMLAQVNRFAVVLVFAALIPVAGFIDGPAKYAIWTFAIVCDFGGAFMAGVDGWRLDHPRHFAERHGLIIIVALGESIVAIGIGAGIDLDLAEIAAASLAIVVVAMLWWSYFDVVARVAEERLVGRTGVDRVRAARDSYSMLHFPMIAGIVLFALGTKKTLEHPEEHLKLVAAVGLCGGVALYYLAHIAVRLRNVGTLSRRRIVTHGRARNADPVDAGDRGAGVARPRRADMRDTCHLRNGPLRAAPGRDPPSDRGPHRPAPPTPPARSARPPADSS